jgi:hypothetical protein
VRVDEHACFWVSDNKSLEIDKNSPLLESCKAAEKIHAEIVTVGIPVPLVRVILELLPFI